MRNFKSFCWEINKWELVEDNKSSTKNDYKKSRMSLFPRPISPLKFIKVKKKGSFYIAQYPVRWPAQSASHFLPSLTDLFIPTPFSASPGSILARQQLRAKTKSLTFPPLSIAWYSFIQLSRQGRQWRERKMPNLRNGSKGDSNPGSLDCESGILPLSYCAPPYILWMPWTKLMKVSCKIESRNCFDV